MKAIKTLITAFALISGTAQASLVTLQASWSYPRSSEKTDFLTFTFDDSVQDSLPDDHAYGSYSAITSLDYTSNGSHFKLAEGGLNKVIVYSPASNHQFGPPNWIIADVIRDDGTTGLLEMRIESFKYPMTDEIRSIMNITQDDDSYLNISSPSGSLSHSLILNAGKIFTETAPVPAPMSAWLFGSSLLSLISTSRRKVANQL